MKQGRFAKNRILSIGAIAALTATIGACGSAKTTGAGPNTTATGGSGTTANAGGGGTITIGWISDTSGPASIAGIPNLKGAQLAVKNINASGGVLGKDLKLLVANEQSVPSVAIAAIQKYVSNPNVFIIDGGSDSNDVLAASSIVDQAKVPWIVDSASSSAIGSKSYLFPTQILTNYEMGALTKVAIAKYHPKSISVVYATNDYGESGAKAIQAAAQQAGVTVNKPISTSVTATDYGPALQLVAQQNPSILISVVYNAGPLGEQAEAQGLKVPLLFSGALPIEPAMKPLATAGKLTGLTTDLTSPTLIADNTSSPQMNTFVSDYHNAYGAWPDLSGLNGYNSIEVIVAALKTAGKVNRADFVQALTTMGPIDTGLTYPEQFTATDHAGEKKISLITFKDNTVPGPHGLYGDAQLTPEAG